MTYLCEDIVCQCGATEIGLIARAMVRDVLTRTVLVGVVVPGVEVGVFDAAGDRCGPERIGFIKLRRTADAAAGGSRSRAGYRRVSPTGCAWIVTQGVAAIAFMRPRATASAVITFGPRTLT
jgi:acyl-coenzyme A synthetase/AMP-(fatty) acid ligase